MYPSNHGAKEGEPGRIAPDNPETPALKPFTADAIPLAVELLRSQAEKEKIPFRRPSVLPVSKVLQALGYDITYDRLLKHVHGLTKDQITELGIRHTCRGKGEESRRKRVERESGFRRDACIAYTLSQHGQIYLNLPITQEAAGVEQRFLPDDVYTYGDRYGRHVGLRSVDDRIAGEIEHLHTRAAAITDQELRDEINQHSQQIASLGPQLLEQAPAAQVREMTEADLQGFVNTGRRPLADRFADPYFSPRGWEIFQRQEDGQYVLILRQENNRNSWSLVNLNQLDQHKPTAVREFIQQYYFLFNLESIKSNVSYFLSFHEVPQQAIVPAYVYQLGHTQDQEQELRQIEYLADWFSRLNVYYSGRSETVIGSVRNRSTTLDRDSLVLRFYLEHINNCPGGDRRTRSQAQVYTNVVDNLISIDIPWTQEKPSDVKPELWEIFRFPSRYTADELSYSEQTVAQFLEQDRNFMVFIEATRLVETYEGVLEQARIHMPEMHEKLNQFRAWLGQWERESQFESFMTECVRSLSIASIEPDSGSLESILDLVREELNLPTSLKLVGRHTDWGRHYPEYGSKEFHLSDKQLEQFLGFLVVKRTLESIKTDPTIYSDSKTYMQGRISRLNESLDDLTAKVDQSREDNQYRLSKIQAQRATMEELMSQINVRPEDVESLSKRYRSSVSIGGPNRFDIIFNLLYLSKTGKLNLQSPVMNALIAEYFPEIPREAIEEMRQM